MKITLITRFVEQHFPSGLTKVLRRLYSIFKAIKMGEKKCSFGNRNIDKTFYVIRLFPPASGILSNYIFILGYIQKALDHGWVPIVDMLNYKTQYSTSEPINGSKNAWEIYFSQPSTYSLEDVYDSKNVILADGNLPLYDNSMSPEALSSQIKASELVPINNYLSNQISDKYGQTLNLLEATNTIGVAVRGTDYNTIKPANHPVQPNIEYLIKVIKEKQREWMIDNIFVATEEAEIIEILNAKFNNLLWIDRPRFSRFGGKKLITETDIDGFSQYDITFSYIAEMYLLSKCTALIGAKNSGFITTRIWNKNKYKHIEVIDLGVYA